MENELFDLHLPNAYGCIQSALFQLERGNLERTQAFLEAAGRSLSKAGIHPQTERLSSFGGHSHDQPDQN